MTSSKKPRKQLHHTAAERTCYLADEQFLKKVTNGRKGTQMPAFGSRLSVDEIWQLHAFVKSTDHF